MTYGSVDVGYAVTQNIAVTNQANGIVAFPNLTVTGDFTASTNCGAFVAALGTCNIAITFKPSTTGTRTGTMTATSSDPAYAAVTSNFTGNVVDFTTAIAPTTGSVIAGLDAQTTMTVTPIAGFSNLLNITCTSNAPDSTCVATPASFAPAGVTTVGITITTGSKYTVIGYGGTGKGLLALLAIGSGLLLCLRRKRAGALVRISLTLCLLAAAGLMTTGCSGKLPAENESYTSPGNYTYTVTATDGFLSHSNTYALTVNAK